MILLFGNKSKTSSTRKNSGINNPVENSGILAKSNNPVKSLLAANEYDIYMFSQQAEVDYSQYSDFGNDVAYSGFMSSFANAYSTLGECSGDTSSFSSVSSFGGDCSCSSCGSFSSVC